MQVFISFSSADRKIAEKIHDRLNKNGVDCWICTKDIPPGADYQSCIVEAINACKVVVLVFSSNANLSPEIAKELSLASKKILIPARIEDVVPQGSFQYQLSNRQFVDLFDDFDEKLDELIGRIKSVLAAPGEAPSAPTTRKKSTVRSSSGGMKMAVGAACVVALAAGGWLVKGKLAGPAGADAAVSTAAPPGAAVLARAAAPAPVGAQAAALTQAQPNSPATEAATLAPAPAPEGPSQLTSVVPLLTGTQNSERVNLLTKMNDRIPMNLDSKDANLLLADANGYRASAIRAIAPHLAPGMGGAALARVLGDISNSERVNSIALLASSGKIKESLTAQEAKLVLDGTGGYRASGVKALVSQLPKAMGGRDGELILQEISNSERANSIAILASNGKLRQPLTAQEAKQILDGTNGYRASGVKEMLAQLPPAMGGRDGELILQEISNSERANSIALLASNGKLKQPLTAQEAKQILDGTNGYRASGVKQMLAQLPPAMGGKDAALVLQDIANSERVNSLTALAGAGKLNAALTPEDARILLEGTHGYRLAGINAIVRNLAGELDTKALTMILGDTANSDRLNALSALATNNRIGKLQSADLDPILTLAAGYRGQAAQVIAPFVSR
jgi:hypothetical protein